MTTDADTVREALEVVRKRGMCGTDDMCAQPNPQDSDCAACLDCWASLDSADEAMDALVARIGQLEAERDERLTKDSGRALIAEADRWQAAYNRVCDEKRDLESKYRTLEAQAVLDQEHLTRVVAERAQLEAERDEALHRVKTRHDDVRRSSERAELAYRERDAAEASLVSYRSVLHQIEQIDRDEWHYGQGWECVAFIQDKARATLAAGSSEGDAE